MLFSKMTSYRLLIRVITIVLLTIKVKRLPLKTSNDSERPVENFYKKRDFLVSISQLLQRKDLPACTYVSYKNTCCLTAILGSSLRIESVLVEVECQTSLVSAISKDVMNCVMKSLCADQKQSLCSLVMIYTSHHVF